MSSDTTPSPPLQDSPLSTTASVAGILTFLVALLAAAYVRLTYLRNADTEYFRVKASLSWYKTESTWMYELVHAAEARRRRSVLVPRDGGEQNRATGVETGNSEKEYQIYAFVMEQLVQLERRLLSLLTQVEIEANKTRAPVMPETGLEAAGLLFRRCMRGLA